MSKINGKIVIKSDEIITVRMPYTDLDDRASEHFKANFTRLLNKNYSTVVILDFSKINLIDGSGIAAILYAYSLCSKKGIQLITCCLNASGQKLFKQKGVDLLIPNYNNYDDALISAKEYLKNMKFLCVNYNRLDKTFGTFNEGDKLPLACTIIDNDSQLLRVS